MANYTGYVEELRRIMRSGQLGAFKQSPAITPIYEHVTKAQGQQYLKLLQEESTLSFDVIKAFCAENDKHGQPKMEQFLFGPASPTSLRYLYHTHLALTHFKRKFDTTPIRIVEVGGGYGGLCLAMYRLAPLYGVKLAGYTIIDLDDAVALQSLYLLTVAPTLSPPVQWSSAEGYGALVPAEGAPLALISNYCFSELTAERQQQYLQTLFPKVKAGFLAWNFIPVYDLGRPLTVEDEKPNTGPANKFVTF